MMYTKYPRTLHLPWSEGATKDDLVLKNTDHFEGRHVAITEKMDGECTTMYQDYVHARSLTLNNHPSRAWIKRFHAQIKHNIPRGWRICGENMYARHSIFYRNLESYFLGFSVWPEGNYAMGWTETCEYFDLLGVSPVPVLYTGIFRSDEIRDAGAAWTHKNDVEGYVVRLFGEFHFTDFQTSVAKWVRKGHVQTDEHWMNKPVVPNELQVEVV